MAVINKITFIFVYGILFFAVVSTVRIFDISQNHHIVAAGIVFFMIVTILLWMFFHGGAREISGFFWKHLSWTIPIAVIISMTTIWVILHEISKVGNELVACLDQFVKY